MFVLELLFRVDCVPNFSWRDLRAEQVIYTFFVKLCGRMNNCGRLDASSFSVAGHFVWMMILELCLNDI